MAVADISNVTPRIPNSTHEIQLGAETLRDLYEPIAGDLARVEEILEQELQSEFPCVDRLARHGMRLGGKRLRPALVLLAAQACGKTTHEHLTLAAVVEMVHTATLVHDDVLDSALVRRHLDSVNSRWGNRASILLGDFLFTHAFYLASTLPTTMGCQSIGWATNRVCEGELRQIDSQGNFDLSEQEYLSIIESKTAELCACSCKLGAHYAGADQHRREAFDRFGRCLGIAFQIADDILDLVGDETSVGKSLGTDLDQQKPTLAVIHLLREVDPGQRAPVLDILGGPREFRRQLLEPWLARTGSLDYARRRAGEYALLAGHELAGLCASPSRTVLQKMCAYVVERRQ